jgi:hypothetical protein
MVEYLDVERNWEATMYQPLALDRVRVERELLRLRAESASRRPQLRPLAFARRGRAWWPRPRRSVLRLALEGVGLHARATKPCVDC